MRCLRGIGRTFQIPQPFEKLTVFENLLVAGGVRIAQARGGGRRPLRRRSFVETGTVRPRQSAGGRARPPATQTARAGARARHRSEAAASRRNCRRPDRSRMSFAGRDDPRRPPKGRFHHLDRARPARAERRRRPVAGAQFRQGHRPRQAGRDHGLARSPGNLRRDRSLMALLEINGLTARYGDFQALFGVDMTLEPGETIAIVGANGAGKSTLMRSIAGRARQSGRADPLRRAADRRLARGRRHGARHRDGARGEEAVSLALGRGEPAHRQVRPPGARDLVAGDDLRLVPGPEGATRRLPRRRFPAASSRWRRSAAPSCRTRAFCSATRSASGSRRSSSATSMRFSRGFARRARPSSSSSRTSARALKVADRVYCMMEGRITLSGSPAGLTRDAIHAAYFGAAGW